jgi:hypothetical protein
MAVLGLAGLALLITAVSLMLSSRHPRVTS